MIQPVGNFKVNAGINRLDTTNRLRVYKWKTGGGRRMLWSLRYEVYKYAELLSGFSLSPIRGYKRLSKTFG